MGRQTEGAYSDSDTVIGNRKSLPAHVLLQSVGSYGQHTDTRSSTCSTELDVSSKVCFPHTAGLYTHSSVTHEGENTAATAASTAYELGLIFELLTTFNG